MKIVFDTNIWISHFGLNSVAGASIRFYIKEKGADVVVPEVVRLEFEQNFTQKLQKLKQNIIDSHDSLLMVFGELKEVVLPSDEEINNRASEILNRLDVPIKEIPLSLEAAKSSFLKTINKQPPSKIQQQFKDGVIWANCLELLNESDVYLVSEDKDFYEDGNYRQGLASNLREETKQYSNNLKLISSLKELLVDIREDVDVDDRSLIKGIYESSGDKIYEILDKEEFTLKNSPAITKSLFLTENSSQLYIEFQISYDCFDQTDRRRTDASIEINGSGLYEKEKEEFLKVSIPYVSLQYLDTEGQEQSRGFHSVSAHLTAGFKTVEHTVKHQLSD